MKGLDDSSRLLDDIGGLESTINRLEASFKKLTESAASFTNTMRGGMNGTTSAGTGGVGSSGPNILGGSLSQVSPFMLMNGRASRNWNMASGAMQMGSSILGGALAALPDVNTAMGMAQGQYAAGFSSSTNWRKVGTATFSYMKGGMNIAGAQGVVAGIANSYGMQFGGGNLAGGAGQFANIARGSASAARLLNQSNDVAANAMANLYTGSTSMSLMQNFGIMTTDPMSGKSANPTQIYAMLNNRLTGGGRMSAEQVKTALGPGGMMTANINATFQDQAQRDQARAYILNAAKGNYLDFSNPESKANQEAIRAAGGNPEAANMKVTQANNQTMQTAVDSYVKGMNDAAGAVVKFQDAVNGFLQTPMGKMMAQGAGAVNLASNSNAVNGAAGALPGVIGGAASMIGAQKSYKGLQKVMSTLGKGTEAESAAATAARATRGLSALGKAGGVTSLALGGMTLASDAMSGQGWGTKQFSADMGSTIGGTIGSIAGSFIPIPVVGTVLGGMAGSWIGGMVGSNFGRGGENSSINTGSSSASSANFKLSRPVKGGKITSTYNAKNDSKYHANGHKGIDFGVGEGTQVFAAADGIVKDRPFEYGYGQVLRIDHGNGYVTLYAHLSQVQVQVGDKVTVGQPVALSGNTGHWTEGAHLHFGLYLNGNPCDPMPLLTGVAGFVSPSGTPTSDIAGQSGAGTSTVSAGSPAGTGVVGSAGSLGLNSGTMSGGVPQSYSGASAGYSAASGASIGAASSSTGSVGNDNKGGGDPGPSRNVPNVSIHVTVAQASESEAKRLAQMVKRYIEQDSMMLSMGSK